MEVQSQEPGHHLNVGADWAEKSLLVPLNFIITHLVNLEDDFKFTQLGFLLFAKAPI